MCRGATPLSFLVNLQQLPPLVSEKGFDMSESRHRHFKNKGRDQAVREGHLVAPPSVT